MRTAKAEYIRALKDLRAADAEYTRAKAAVEQANARYRDAETAFKNAQVENQNLLNEYQELLNEAKAQQNEYEAANYAALIAELEMKIEKEAAEHAVTMVKQQEALAKAQESLRVVLRDIAIAAKSLSPNEKLAVVEAAALYYGLVQEEINAGAEVAKAQITVDTLVEYKTRFADTAWSRGKLVGVVEKYENDIELAELKIGLRTAAMVATPDSSASLEEWKKEVEKYNKEAAEVKAKKAQQAYDSVAFEQSEIVPGIAAFNAEIASFIKENWWRDSTNLENEKYNEPDWNPLTDGVAYHGGVAPKQEDYTKVITPGPKAWLEASDFTKKLVIAKDGVTQNPWFTQFAYLLGTYTEQDNYWEPGKKLIETGSSAKADTMKIGGKLKGDTDGKMRLFIVGDKGGDGDQTRKYAYNADTTLVADYGLWGAYEVLSRIYEASTNPIADSAARFQKEAEDAVAEWTKQNAILKAGLAAFEPYQNAIDEFVDAAEIYNDKVEEMNNAINGFVNVWNARYTTGHDWGKDDSTAVLNAILAFAQAREDYLEGWADTVKKYAAPQKNPNYVYYVAGIDPYKVDSIKISDLTIEKIREKSALSNLGAYSKYEIMPVTANKAADKTRHVLNSETIDTYNSYNYTNDHGVFDWIVYNMLGETAYNQANGSKVISENYYRAWNEVTTENIGYIINGNEGDKGLFFQWHYVTGSSLTNGKVVNKVTSGEVGSAAVLAAEKAVLDSVAAYVAVYNKYWGKNLTAEATNYPTFVAYFDKVLKEAASAGISAAKEAAEDSLAVLFDSQLMETDKTKDNFGKLKEDSYELSIFNPHPGDETPLALFTPGTAFMNVEASTIIGTEALRTILESVDPYTVDINFFTADNVDGSAIFYGGNPEEPVTRTTAYKALYWKYMYWLSQHQDELKDALEAIKAWITDVENVFITNETAKETKGPDTAAYNTAVDNFNKAVAKKAKYDKYVAAKKAFAGTHIKMANDTVVNPVLVKVTTVTAPDAKLMSDEVFTITTPANVQSYFAKNLIGVITGWDENKLGGEQLENAEIFFEGYPEMIAECEANLYEWAKDEADASNFATLANAAYMAKAELEGYDRAEEGDDIATLYGKYRTAYKNLIQAYVVAIKELGVEIDNAKHAIAAYKSEVPDFDGLIVEALKTLEKAQAKLNAIQKAKEQAKINLDKIMEYIRSTDAEFVIPVTVEDMNLLIKSLADSLDKTFGIDLEYLINSFAEELGIDLGDNA